MGVLARRWLFGLIVVLFLVSACQPQPLASLPEQLAKKQADLTSYQITLQLEQSDGQQLVIQQWYQAPDRLRTDVLQAGNISYQCFLRGADLTVRHVPSGQEEQLRLSSENALFTAPLLLELWREGQTANWQAAEERPSCYLGEFAWRDLSGEPKIGSLWLDKRTLLPEEVSLFFGSTQVLKLRFENIKLNPVLEEQLFHP